MALITLARHGEPDWDFRTPIPGYALGDWVSGVDHAPLEPVQSPSPRLLELAGSASVVAASTLRRSLESAAVLAPDRAPIVDPMFREVFLPTAFRTRLRLPPRLWNFLARTAWYCGWSPGVETHAEARRRATAAAGSLVRLATEQGDVLLIAHGVMNGLIGAQLRRTGWRGPLIRPRRYWGFAVFRPAAARVPIASERHR